MRALSVSSPLPSGAFFLFSALGLVLPPDHGTLALFFCDFCVFLQKPAFPQGKAAAMLLLAAQMVIHLALQFLVDGLSQLADVAVRLPTHGSKPGGAVQPQ